MMSRNLCIEVLHCEQRNLCQMSSLEICLRIPQAIKSLGNRESLEQWGVGEVAGCAGIKATMKRLEH